MDQPPSSDDEDEQPGPSKKQTAGLQAVSADAVPVNSKRPRAGRGRGGRGARAASTVPSRPPPPAKPDAQGRVPMVSTRRTTELPESYTDDERKLNTFLSLHGMLSLDATSSSSLQLAADLLPATILPTRDVPVVGKLHDDSFLRPPNSHAGERACCIGDRCIARFLAIFRYGQESEFAVPLREYLLPDEEREFSNSGKLPATQSKCLLCTRYFITFSYRLARADPHFDSRAKIPVFAYSNVVGDAVGEELVQTASVVSDTADGYPTTALLGVDAEFASTEAASGLMGTLLSRPVVGFNSADYTFVETEEGHRIVQDFRGAGSGTQTPLPAHRATP